MKTLVLPKRRADQAQHIFKRQWHDYLTEMQLAAIIDRLGSEVENVVSVNLAVSTKNGAIEMIEAPKP